MDLHISFSGLDEIAAKIRSNNAALNECLLHIQEIMNQLEGSWESDAAVLIRERFNAFSTRFAQYEEVVESYAAYLDKTSEQYRLTESALTRNASSFQ